MERWADQTCQVFTRLPQSGKLLVYYPKQFPGDPASALRFVRDDRLRMGSS
ncbi:MAG: hypothetical protein WD059_10065 [Balneolaceae bacterium]